MYQQNGDLLSSKYKTDLRVVMIVVGRDAARGHSVISGRERTLHSLVCLSYPQKKS